MRVAVLPVQEKLLTDALFQADVNQTRSVPGIDLLEVGLNPRDLLIQHVLVVEVCDAVSQQDDVSGLILCVHLVRVNCVVYGYSGLLDYVLAHNLDLGAAVVAREVAGERRTHADDVLAIHVQALGHVNSDSHGPRRQFPRGLRGPKAGCPLWPRLARAASGR